MSSYSNVTPRIIDPVFDRSNRAEFRLPAGNVYLSSMRLINIGAVTATAATNYNPSFRSFMRYKVPYSF